MVPGDLRDADAAAAAGLAGDRGRAEHADLRPTGSGKTLAAFLAGLDPLAESRAQRGRADPFYISPLKALNQDISRNLESRSRASWRRPRELGTPLPAPGRRPERRHARPRPARIVRKPPDILITTPESLHLMLTSRARETLRSRLPRDRRRDPRPLPATSGASSWPSCSSGSRRINPAGFVRDRPLGHPAAARRGRPLPRRARGRRAADGPDRFEPRPVTIVDAGQRKELDLEVIGPVRPGRPAAAGLDLAGDRAPARSS